MGFLKCNFPYVCPERLIDLAADLAQYVQFDLILVSTLLDSITASFTSSTNIPFASIQLRFPTAIREPILRVTHSHAAVQKSAYALLNHHALRSVLGFDKGHIGRGKDWQSLAMIQLTAHSYIADVTGKTKCRVRACTNTFDSELKLNKLESSCATPSFAECARYNSRHGTWSGAQYWCGGQINPHSSHFIERRMAVHLDDSPNRGSPIRSYFDHSVSVTAFQERSVAMPSMFIVGGI